jgi:hypothetical protein
MKKTLIFMLTICVVSFAIPPKGGMAPCLATCCFGPRVGLEMNEGTRLRAVEKNYYPSEYAAGYYNYLADGFWGPLTGESMNEIRENEKLGGVSVKATPASLEERGGCGACFTWYCFGPRVAYELNDGRKIRAIEWWNLFVPVIPQVMMFKEAYDGKTMSEVVAEEGLDIADPVKPESGNKKH